MTDFVMVDGDKLAEVEGDNRFCQDDGDKRLDLS